MAAWKLPGVLLALLLTHAVRHLCLPSSDGLMAALLADGPGPSSQHRWYMSLAVNAQVVLPAADSSCGLLPQEGRGKQGHQAGEHAAGGEWLQGSSTCSSSASWALHRLCRLLPAPRQPDAGCCCCCRRRHSMLPAQPLDAGVKHQVVRATVTLTPPAPRLQLQLADCCVCLRCIVCAPDGPWPAAAAGQDL